MKPTVNKKSYFFKLSLSLLLLIFFCVTILTTAFWRIFTTNLENNLYKEYKNSISRSKLTFDHIMSEIAQVNYTLLSDPRIDYFLGSREEDPVMRYYAQLNASRLSVSNAYIAAVGIYNAKADLWIETGSAPLVREEALKQPIPGEARTLFGWKYQQNDMFTVVYSKSDKTGFEYHVFITIRAEQIASHIFGEQDYPNYLITNDYDMLISNNQTTHIDFNHIPVNTDDVHIMKEGQNVIFSLPDKTWPITFVEVHPYTEILQLSRKGLGMFSLIALATLGVLFAVAVIISRRLYRPLKVVTQKISSSNYLAKQDATGEFEIISDVYDRAISDIRSLREKRHTNLPRIQADFLRRLLTHGPLTSQTLAEVSEKAMELQLPLDFSRLYVASLHIDQFSEHDIYAEAVIYDQTKELLNDHLSHHFMTMTVPDNKGNTAIFMSCHKQLDDTSEQELLQNCLNEVLELMIEHCGIEATISVADRASAPEEYPEVYKQARRLMDSRFILGYNRVITSASIAHLSSELIVYPRQLMSEIISTLRQGNREAFETNLHSFNEILSGYTVNTARMLFSQLSHDCIQEVHRISTGTKGLSTAVTSSLLSPATLSEGAADLMILFDRYQEQKANTDKLKDDKYYKVIGEAKDYIQEAYADPMLNVDLLAEKFNYSPNYFSKLFKNLTNYFISDYIKQVRLAKAQELITGTEMSISDIANQVGFPNSNYFYVLFKKETGLTPSRYRELQVRQR